MVFGVYGTVNKYLLPLSVIDCLTKLLLCALALSKISKWFLYFWNIWFCKKSTNLSFVEPPISYNIHPKHFWLEIADNNVNFLNIKLSSVFTTHLLPISHLEYSPQTFQYAAEKLHGLAHKYCEGRIVAMGGGGYSPENTAKAWVNVVEAFLGN